MGVDYLCCNKCEDTFADCGYYVGCPCGNDWCSDKCAKAEGFREEIDEETQETIDDSGTCNFCRNDDFPDWELFKFTQGLLGKSREELVELYKENKGNVKTATISKGEYEGLLESQHFLNCLEAMGVDNWEGYGDACEMSEEEE
ncbi:hypothetical protein [Bacillus cereus]|uniref:Uncharacterized protein n=1 Tax=Bacillus cereus HuA3-9 TaxID=1053205 RepID=R8CI85_BACCE|nr:hypothetical protein [Bacillus cereus]EOO11307.1 hypothetical protein IGA_05570 [Bacillus cereus HuA3-9]